MNLDPTNFIGAFVQYLLKISGRNSCPPTSIIYSFLEIEKSDLKNKFNQHPKFFKSYM